VFCASWRLRSCSHLRATQTGFWPSCPCLHESAESRFPPIHSFYKIRLTCSSSRSFSLSSSFGRSTPAQQKPKPYRQRASAKVTQEPSPRLAGHSATAARPRFSCFSIPCFELELAFAFPALRYAFGCRREVSIFVTRSCGYSSGRRSEYLEGAHSNPANLAAELPTGRTPKRGFNAAQGDFSDAPQLCPRCPVGGLNTKARHDRGQVTRKVCRLDFSRELAFRLCALQTLLQSRFTAFSPIDHRELYMFCLCATCQGPLD
jgi:hypothetical protein